MDTRSLTPEQLQEAIEQNKSIHSEFFDLSFAKSINKHVLEPLASTYFRSVFIGFEELPERSNPSTPLIFASNHSGMAFPWDGIIYVSGMAKLGNFGKNIVRPLTSPMLSMSTLMNPYLIRDLWKRVGSIDATTLNFETMMQFDDYNVLIYPEGVPGIAKGFSRRYQLQRMSTSSLRMALKYRTDIIPVACVNGEYINPYHYSQSWVDRLFQLIGIPFLPLGPITLLLLLQPWIFYMGFPAKLTFVRGRRIKPYEMLDKPFEDISREELEGLRDQIGEIMQGELNKAVEQYGRKPYRWGEFFRSMWRQRKHFPFYLPFGWPLLFAEFERQWKTRKPHEIKLELNIFSCFRIILQNPFVLTYYIPVLGWIPFLIKGYRNAQIKPKK